MKKKDNTVLENIEDLLVIEKSKFITNLVYVKDMKDAQDQLLRLQQKYRDATHNCYAIYISEASQKASDDGEPQGTAGIPMLTVLKQNKIHNCLAVVTRYYGGKKLGAGGLIRAYSNAVSSTLQKAKIGVRKQYFEKQIKINYNNLAWVKQKLYDHGCVIKEEIYLQEEVIFEISIESDNLQYLEKLPIKITKE